jgi:hypothetical protein
MHSEWLGKGSFIDTYAARLSKMRLGYSSSPIAYENERGSQILLESQGMADDARPSIFCALLLLARESINRLVQLFPHRLIKRALDLLLVLSTRYPPPRTSVHRQKFLHRYKRPIRWNSWSHFEVLDGFYVLVVLRLSST